MTAFATDSEVRAPLDESVERALRHLEDRQHPDGSWHGDYGGPLFLLPMYVGVAHLIDLRLDDPSRREMRRYLENTQHVDGGFGLHVEGPSMVFTTALCYVAARLLGADAEDAGMRRAREWLHRNGGPLSAAPWGKFFLALLGLYDYRGLSPVPPELWLLPRSLPMHPGRMWCHCRMVYLPMSYLYGIRYRGEDRALTHALREELYPGQDYGRIDWASARDRLSPRDAYSPPTMLMKGMGRGLAAYERFHAKTLRARALAEVLTQIEAEDRNTSYICIGPISKLFHTLIWHHVDPGGAHAHAHREQLPDYLYPAEDGLKMQGYNSSQLWDTAFAVQAAARAGAGTGARAMLAQAGRFIDDQQVRDEVPDRRRHYRGRSKGGWPFSTRTHGWPITDCTAEGIKAELSLRDLGLGRLGDDRLRDAATLLLDLQNRDGGWATYERTRGPRWLEWFNPSGCFSDIMIDYSYVECTSASMQALREYGRRVAREDERNRIADAMERGRAFLWRSQRPDGSWEGSWGVCFTYGTWFGVSGLKAAGVRGSADELARAGDFLAARQLSDGGWGELTWSNYTRRYVSSERGQAVMTSWALLALMELDLERDQHLRDAAARGLRFLIDRMGADGRYPAEHIAGIFNKTTGIHYDNYLAVFPLWALADARRRGLRPA